MRESVTYDKSKAFAVRIVRMCKWLQKRRKNMFSVINVYVVAQA